MSSRVPKLGGMRSIYREIRKIRLDHGGDGLMDFFDCMKMVSETF